MSHNIDFTQEVLEHCYSNSNQSDLIDQFFHINNSIIHHPKLNLKHKTNVILLLKD